jgi:putative ABC transport system permease protein
MGNLLQELRFGFRLIRKNPGFAAIAILVLGLGIGANTAIFSVVNGVLLRPLPYPQPDQLVRVWHTPPAKSFPGMTRFSVSAANFVDWKAQSKSFDGLAMYNYTHATMTGGNQPQVVRITRVTDGFFGVFRMQPILGRTFTADEDQSGRGHVLMLSNSFWKSQFGGDASIVGRKINFEDETYTVVGVAPASFRYPEFAQAWAPMAWTDKEKAVRGEHHSGVVGRLKGGVDLKQAQAEMDAISARLADEYPEDDKGWGAVVVPLHEDLVGDVRPALLVLLGAVGFVLLIACANVANLLLAKTLARQKEAAIRAVLGASGGRIVRQILVETVLLSAAGGALGFALAHFGVSAIAAFLGDNLPQSMDIAPDVTVLAFTMLVSFAIGIAAGVAPAWRLTKINLNEALKSGLGRTDADTAGNRTRQVLVVCEVALSLVLLAGAGLMIRSVWNLRQVNPGFDPHNLLTMTLPVSATRFAGPAEEVSFLDQVMARVRALPGVESAGVIDDLPLSGEGGSNQPIQIEGQPVVAMADQPEVSVRVISPTMIHVLRIPLISGRELRDADTADAPGVVLISQALARRFWPNENPLGKRLTLTFFPSAPREIVGVVGDVKEDSLDTPEPAATLYFPAKQLSVPKGDTWRAFSLSMAVRTNVPASSLSSAVTGAVHQLSAEQPVEQMSTMEDLIAVSLAPQKFNMLMLASFAGLALLLAAVGIYSVLSYAVRRRTREIGIRMALGAQVRDVLRLVVADGMKPTLIGVVIGVAGALLLSRAVAKLVYGVNPSDPATLLAVALILAGVAFLASVIPAYRATKVEPMTALHEE